MTEDDRLRTQIPAACIGVKPLDGDAFAIRLWDSSPAGVDEAIRQMIAKRRACRCQSPRWRRSLPPTFRPWARPGSTDSDGDPERLQAAARPREAAKLGSSAVSSGQADPHKTAGHGPPLAIAATCGQPARRSPAYRSVHCRRS